MDMVELLSAQDFASLEPDKWGIPTPTEESLSRRANSFGSIGKSDGELGSNSGAGLDLIVMPALAFDRDLGRLGHGKGYYDLFLNRTRKHMDRDAKTMPFLGKT